ncbi:MAG TPA: acyltransferase [Planctomycetes bacterium]|nr:acyltransferase [Planctomycetota bacterium]
MVDYLKDREPSFDALRGIAIIAVVAIHTIPWRYYQDYAVLSYRQLLNFAVPAFLFISGYWLSKKPVQSFNDYKYFLKKRLLRIFIPYLFWSLIFLTNEAVKLHNIDFLQSIFKLLTGGVSDHFYFVIVIAQLYILTPFLSCISRRAGGIILVAILNIMGLFVMYLLNSHKFHLVGETHLLTHAPFYSWILFYAIGLWMGNREEEIIVRPVMRSAVLPVILIPLVISMLEAMFMVARYDNWKLAICALKYSSFLYSGGVIIGFWIIRNHVESWPGWLLALGECSFGIYLMHKIPLRMIARIIPETGVIYHHQFLYQLIVVVTTLGICCVVICVTRKLLPKVFYRGVLGF